MALKETLSYSDGVKGWPSFYSYLPDYMVGMNSYFYTFNRGNLYRHNTGSIRNQYYNVNYKSSITSVFNVEPQTIKLFKTMSFESDDAWAVTSLSTELSTGSMLSTNFVEKEAEWFSFIRANASTVNFKLRSTNGIGVLINYLAVAPLGSFELTFSVSLSSILSIGDNMYYQPAATPGTSRKIGVVTNVNRTTNIITIATILNTPTIGDFIFFYKDPVAESHGARGYYMRFTLENLNTNAVELFSVGSSIMKSYP